MSHYSVIKIIIARLLQTGCNIHILLPVFTFLTDQGYADLLNIV